MRSDRWAGNCSDCGATLERRQRYCTACGTRCAPRLVRAIRSSASGILGGVSSLRLPSGKVSALLVMAFLGFGVIVGNEAASPAGYALDASAAPHLKLIVAQTAAADRSSSSAASSSAVEPPASEREQTPEAAPATAGSSGEGSAAPSSSTKSSSTKGSSGAKGGSQGGGSSGARPRASSSKLPPIKHVFVIMLSDQPYAAVFGPASSAPYLSHTLERRGELLVRYYAVAHEELANEIALLSGQGPTPETAANCPVYADIAPATVGAEGQVTGQGCVYPQTTGTLAGQLTAKHMRWRAYVEGIGESTTGDPACDHPALGAADPTATQTPFAAAYATFRDPLVYFDALTSAATCAADVVGLDKLAPDLANPARTPNFSYIVPDGCHDGNPTPCASGAPAGLPAANAYLQQVVGKILASKAYKQNGLLVITVDEAPSSGEFADSSSCCGQPRFPNLPAATSRLGLAAPGGGQVGALLLSPFIKPATTSQEPYNHFSLLRTIEDLFGLKHLAYAASPHVSSFEPSVFSAYTPG